MAQGSVEHVFHSAVQHHQAGRVEQAEAGYREVLARQADHAGALHFLGVIASQAGRHDTAVELIRRAVALNPDWTEAHCNLGKALQSYGRFDDAIAAYRRAVALRPDFPEAHYNLATALKDAGRDDEAIAAYRQAIALRGEFPQAHHNLANALKDSGHPEEAVRAFRQAIALRPDWPDAYNNLGNALRDAGHSDEAIGAYGQAIALDPRYARAHGNLGLALKDMGQLDEAIAAFRRAVALQGDDPVAHSNLIYALRFHPASDDRAMAEEHGRWNRRFAEPLRGGVGPHRNDRDPGRRLRIGYVSGDFRRHVVALCVEPVLAHHDGEAVEVFCYANHRYDDDTTRRLRGYGHHWRSIAGVNDERAAELIGADGIDILVDLSGHTAGNRLELFARRPAPVQVSHVAYPATTGMAAIEYRITDKFLDPGADESLVKLPHGWYCYVRDQDEPVRLRAGGPITFGSLNNLAKMTAPVVELWGRILGAVASARLTILSGGGAQADRWLLEQFARRGVAEGRVGLVGRTDAAGYLRRYHDIDVGLDPFPYNGGITTCDALWMGVPVVTLRGQTSVGRAGVSILSTIGLTELIADSPDDYVRIAVGLAGDLPRLERLRLGMRERMVASPLTDGAGYTRDLEAGYRRMWREAVDRGQ